MDNFKMRKNYSYFIIILLFIVLLFFSSFIKFISISVADKKFVSIKPYGEFAGGKRLKQVIYISESVSLDSISFQIGTYGRLNSGINNFIIYLNGNQIHTYSVLSEKIKDNQFHKIPLNIDLNNGDVLEIVWATGNVVDDMLEANLDWWDTNKGATGNAISPYIADKTFDSKLYIFDNESKEYKETDSTLVYKLASKVSMIDYFTRLVPPASINLTQAEDMISKLNTWIAIKDTPIIQKIDAKGINFVDTLSFRFGTFARINNNINNLYILDEDNNILYKEDILSNQLIDNAIYTIDNLGLKIDSNKEYYIKIESLDADDENCIAIYTMPPNVKAPIKLIDENNNEEVKEESLFYVINNSITADVLANVEYQHILQGSTYKVIEDNKSIRNSKILFCIVWLGLVTSFVLLMSYIIMYIRELGRK